MVDFADLTRVARASMERKHGADGPPALTAAALLAEPVDIDQTPTEADDPRP